MEVIRHTRNVHEIRLKGKDIEIAMLSDLHWDNPKCDRKRLKAHLDYCKEHEIPIMINGDFFCLMQGKYDPRRSKSDIRVEHNHKNYLDLVIETAVEYFKPYAHLLTVIGYGNHETGIIRHIETDPLQRFVDLLNTTCKSNVHTGGYGGWIILKQSFNGGISTTTKIKYFHGSGGGGIVTKGAINLTRALERYEGFDVYSMGHIHENACRNDVRDAVKNNAKMGYQMYQKQIHLMITGAYKEEYTDGAGGWHVERGAPVKPVGGRILTINTHQVRKSSTIKHSSMDKIVGSKRFPI